MDQTIFADVLSLEGALSAAVVALVGAVVFLFGLFRAAYLSLESRLSVANSVVERRLNECEKDRNDLWKKMAFLEGRDATLCSREDCPLKEQ